MTNLEHLIENCLVNFKKGKSSEEIEEAIKKDINFENAGITAEKCYEICQYVWCVFIRDMKENIFDYLLQGYGIDIEGEI